MGDFVQGYWRRILFGAISGRFCPGELPYYHIAFLRPIRVSVNCTRHVVNNVATTILL